MKKTITVCLIIALLLSLTAVFNLNPVATTDAPHAFDRWEGSGNVSVTLRNGCVGFKGLYHGSVYFDDGEPIPEKFYTVSGDDKKTVITLKEEYLQLLVLNNVLHTRFYASFNMENKDDFIPAVTASPDEDRGIVNKVNRNFGHKYEYDEFKVRYNGKEIEKSNYSVEKKYDECTAVFTEEYLKTLPQTPVFTFEVTRFSVRVDIDLWLAWLNAQWINNGSSGFYSTRDVHWDFNVWTGNGDALVILGGDEKSEGNVKSSEFIKLISQSIPVGYEVYSDAYKIVTLSKNNYTLTEADGLTMITLKEAYLKTLEDGLHVFNAYFEKDVIPLRLYVVTEKATLNKDEKFYSFTLMKKLYGGMDLITWYPTGSDYSDNSNNRNAVFFDNSPVQLYATLFEKLTYNGEEVDASKYHVGENSSNHLIRPSWGGEGVFLTEEGLKTLPKEGGRFEAYYKNIEGPITFEFIDKRSEYVPPEPPEESKESEANTTTTGEEISEFNESSQFDEASEQNNSETQSKTENKADESLQKTRIIIISATVLTVAVVMVLVLLRNKK